MCQQRGPIGLCLDLVRSPTPFNSLRWMDISRRLMLLDSRNHPDMESHDTVKPPLPEREDQSPNSKLPLYHRHHPGQLESLPVEDEDKKVIIKELRNVQRQNSITHYLLTAMIIITLGWQLSEVSLIFKIKQGFSHPFKSLGSIIKGFLPKQQFADAAIDFEPPPLPSLKMPDLSYLGLPFDSTDDDD